MVRLEGGGGGGGVDREEDNSEPRSRANNTKCVGLMGGGETWIEDLYLC